LNDYGLSKFGLVVTGWTGERDRQTDKQTDRQTEWQTDTQTEKGLWWRAGCWLRLHWPTLL